MNRPYRLGWLTVAGFMLSLAACGSVPTAQTSPSTQSGSTALAEQGYVPTPTYGLAGQGVLLEQTTIAQERTRTAFDAAVVEATAIAQQTQGARDLLATDQAATSTAQGVALSFQQTVGAATQLAQETQLAFNITVAAATQAVEATHAARALTATAVVVARERHAIDDTVVSWFIGIFCTVLAGIILWYTIRIGRGLAKRADPHQNPNSVRVLRTSVGPLLIIPLPSGGFRRELLAVPSLPPPALETIDAQFETDEELPAELEDVPIYTKGRVTGFYNRVEAKRLSLEEEKNRRFLLRFLEDCMKVNGSTSNVIPSHDRLGVSTETWGKATHLLSPLLEKRRGRNGGTWLVGEHITLREVFVAVGERRFVPRVVEHSPTPISNLATEP